MSLTIDNQTDLLTDKLRNQAVGTLYRILGFVQRTNRWQTNTVMENGASFQLPILGTTATNDRAPGAPVVDTTESPSRREVVIVEKYQSWLTDPTWAASEGKAKFEAQRSMSRTNQLAQDVIKEILTIIATTGGLNAFGTLGVALVKAVIDDARQQLTDDSIPDDRVAIISTDMMTDLNNIPEYSDFEKLGTIGAHADGRVGRAGGFMVQESPYVHVPAPNQHIGFAGNPFDIATVWPLQVEVSGSHAQKRSSEIDGLRLYMLREYVPGFNAAERITLSVRFGAAVHRDEGIVLIRGQ